MYYHRLVQLARKEISFSDKCHVRSDFIPKAHNYKLEQVEPEEEEAWPSSIFFKILSLIDILWLIMFTTSFCLFIWFFFMSLQLVSISVSYSEHVAKWYIVSRNLWHFIHISLSSCFQGWKSFICSWSYTKDCCWYRFLFSF